MLIRRYLYLFFPFNRDILRRHEGNHQRGDQPKREGSASSSSIPKAPRAKKEPKKRTLDSIISTNNNLPGRSGIGLDENPAKVLRISRACDKCSRSK